MISFLHTWGRILVAAGGVLSVLLFVPAFRFGGGLEDIAENRGDRADPRTLHAVGRADPELGRRFLGLTHEIWSILPR